jgi:adhesin transport system outer membrane protein
MGISAKMRKRMKMIKSLVYSCGFVLCAVTSGHGMDIHDAVVETFRTNPDLMVQIEQVQIQKERYNQAASGYKPRLDVRGNAGYEHTYNEFRESEDLEPAAGSVVLTQPLFRGFQTTHALRRTTADTEAAQLQLSGTAEQVAFEVIQTYLQVLATNEIVAIAKRNLKSHEHLQSLIQDRLKEGVSDQSDAAHAEGRLALAHSNLLSAQNNLTDAMSDFEAVSGFSLNTYTRPVVNSDFMPISKTDAIKRGEENQPTLQASKYSVTAAREQYKEINGRYLPRFDIELKGSASEEAVGIDEKEDQASAMVVMNWNLYNGGSDAAEKRATLAQISQAKSSSLRVKRRVEKEIRLAWAALKTTERQKTFMASHVRSSKKAKKLYQDQFELHRRSLLDLLDTENEMFQAERSYISTDYDELTARYRLLAATGQLLEALELADPGETGE